jgi:hypothetical protein
MSESLAEGLVSRFVDEWTRSDLEALDRHPPPQKYKRAAAYRALCDWLQRSVPATMQILTLRLGPQTGKDKGGGMVLVHWQPDPRTKWLLVAVKVVSAHHPSVVSQLLVQVSRHALVRLFQRLRTDDPRLVLDELAQSMKSYWHIYFTHTQLLGRADIMVPTRRGAVAIAADESNATDTVVKTWISDQRMEQSPDRLRAVKRARTEEGFVLMANGRFIVLSRESMKKRTTHEAISAVIQMQLDHEDDAMWKTSL